MPTFFTVATEADLNAAIAAINAGGSSSVANTAYMIQITTDLSLNTDITAINLLASDSLEITGNTFATTGNASAVLDGGGGVRGFVVTGGAVTLDSLGLQSLVAQGGNGGAGSKAGGGGAGLGGGVFVGAGASVALSNVSFSGDAARGGAGGVVGGSGTGAGGSGSAGGFGAGGAGGAAGGFGGGGGSGASGGFGGGANAGGGLGAGGDVFVEQGGQLTITNGAALGAGQVAGGGRGGQAFGDGLFIQGDQAITLGSATISGVIADQSGSGGVGANAGVGTVLIDGDATLSARNTFTGGAQIQAGWLSLQAQGAAGSGAISFTGPATELIIGAGDAPANIITGFSFGDIIDLQGLGGATTVTLGAGGKLTVQGGGVTPVTLNLDPTANYASDTFQVTADGTGGAAIRVLQTQFTIASQGDLNAALAQIDLGGAQSAANLNYTLTFTSGFTLSSDLYAINLAAGDTLTINGGRQTLDGGGAHRGFFVYGGVVTINDLTIQNTVASGGQGGAGAIAGGGGAGLGGALFIASGGAVTLNDVNLIHNQAVGGAGGAIGGTGYGGGGGLGGAGGAGNGGYAGGGGGVGASATGGVYSGGAAGAGILLGAAGGSSGTGTYSSTASPGVGGAFGGGGGSGGRYSGSGRVPRSFPGSAGSGGVSGSGNFGGGAGSAQAAGFGGGGAGYNGATNGGPDSASGVGGFGGGGAGGQAGGFGGGASNGAGGGGGLGAGGGVFVQQGGSLTFASGGLFGGAATGGAGSGGAATGQGLGAGIFIQGGQSLAFAPAAGQTLTVSDSIADPGGSAGGGAIVMTGAGTLALSAANHFSGGLTIESGLVSLNAASAAGTGTITFSYGSTATLQVAAGALPANVISGFLPGDVIDLQGVGVATSAVLGAGDLLTLTGGGVNLSLALDPKQIFTGESFVAQSDGAGGTRITAVTTGGDHPPSISGAGVTTSGDDAAALTPLTGLTVSDLDASQTATATLTLSSSANGGLSNLAGGAYDAATGVYTISGSAAAITAALDGLVFTPVDHEVAPGQSVTTQFNLTVTDGVMSAAASDSAVITALNTAPVISGANIWVTGGYFTVPLNPFPGVSVSDPDVGATETATVTVSTSPFAGSAGDTNGLLALPSSVSGITLTETSPGIYTLSAASPQLLSQALDALIFTPVSNPAAPGFTLTYLGLSITDGAATATASNTIEAGAPVISGVAVGQTTADNTPLAPFSQVVLTDSPGVNSLSVTIQILDASSNPTDLNGVLSGAGLTQSGVGTYTLTAGTPAAVSAALEALVFTPTFHQVGSGQSVTTNFLLQVFDGATTSDNGDTSVIVQSTGSTLAWQGPSAANPSGAWSGAANWTGGAVPTASNSVVIGAAGAYTITTSQAITIESLAITDPTATLVLGAGKTFTLSGVEPSSNAGGINLTAGASLSFAGSLTNTGRLYLNGVNGASVNSAGVPATLINGGATSGSISGAGVIGDAKLTFANLTKGGVNANGAKALVLTAGGGINNAGLLEATAGATLNLQNDAVNNLGGRILAAANSQVQIQGAAITSGSVSSAIGGSIAALGGTAASITGAAIANLGVVEAMGGGALTLSGDTVTGAGQILASGAGSSLTLASTTLTGQTLSATAGGLLTVTGATVLSGVTNTSALHIANGTAGVLKGVLTNAGQISLDSAGALTKTMVSGAVSLTGGGAVTLANQSYISGSGALTNVNNTLSGGGGIGIGSSLTLTNQGTIDANASNALTLNTGVNAVSNPGLLEAQAGGGLNILGAVNNTGRIWANGGAVTVGGALTGTGLDTITGSTLTLGGAVAATQTIAFASGASGTLALGQAQTFGGVVQGFAAGDSIDLKNLLFSGAPTVASVTGTGAVGSDLTVTVTDGATTAKIQLFVQSAGQFSTNPGAYVLSADSSHAATAGTLLQLAPPA